MLAYPSTIGKTKQQQQTTEEQFRGSPEKKKETKLTRPHYIFEKQYG